MLRFIFYLVIFYIAFIVVRRMLSAPKKQSDQRVVDMPPPQERPKVDTTAFTQSGQMDYEITPEQFNKLRNEKGDFTLIDVREPWEHQAARIEGAKLMPMGDVPSRAHEELDPDDHIIVYCHHGVRSMSVASWMRQQGFEKAQSLAGGIDRWAREIDPTVPKY